MLDNDDIRYSAAEDRPPWELGTGGRLREWFNCRKVDDTTAGYCHEVEEQKKARVKAQSHRSASHARMQRQREEAQSRLILEQQAAKQRMAEARERVRADPEGSGNPPPPKDPRGARYAYPRSGGGKPPKSPRRRQKKKSSPATALLVILVIAISTLYTTFSDRLEHRSQRLELPSIIQLPTEEEEVPTEASTQEDGFGRRFGDGDQWDNLLPDADEDEPVQNNLPRAEANSALTVDVHSAQGLSPLSYQDLYRQCLPSTVSIRVYAENGGGTGTGIIFTSDGYILTCNHMVAGGERCSVTTWDDETYEAKLLGADPQTDLAVLKIEASGLTAAQFGDSDELTVGDEVLAIGDPLGTELRGTLTNGIVSAINRNVTVKTYPMTLIQTTAALNSGNSGGPLINLYGQVVGVNNMKMVSNSVTVEGLGFAVPTNVIRQIVPVLASEGKVSRPVLGITCYEIDQEAAEDLELPVTGLRVASINKASHAAETDLQVDDVITHINGQPVTQVKQVRSLLEELGIGEEVSLTVYRPGQEGEGGTELEITVMISDQADLN